MNRLDPLGLPLSGIKLIEASAGTGKTYTIATLYLRLLVDSLHKGEPLSVKNILVVTFTNAATDELRGRIRARLREAVDLLRLGNSEHDDALMNDILQLVEDRRALMRHLENELACMDEAAIHTIHGFCQRMLVENAFESGALFEAEFIQNEDDMINEVVRDYWRRHFYHIDPGLAGLFQQHWSDPDALAQAVRPHLHSMASILPHPASGLNDRIQTLHTQLSEMWKSESETIATLLRDDPGLGRAKDAYRSDVLESALQSLSDYLQAQSNVYLPAADFELFTSRKLEASISPAKRGKGHLPPQHPFFELAESLQSCLNEIVIERWRHAIQWCRDELTQRKQAAGRLAFDDLLIQLDRALSEEGGELLAEHIRKRFPYALIDEFQDTDPRQYRIFATLYRQRPDTGLYLIGDPKQAIYAFRGADVHTYMQAKDDTDADARFTLGTNWRSSSNFITALNTLYQNNPMAFLYPGSIDYQKVEPSPRTDEAKLIIAGEEPPAMTFWFAEREPTAKGKVAKHLGNKDETRQRFAQSCAHSIAQLLIQGQAAEAWIGERPVEARDIAVLVRDRFEAKVIREALSQRNIGTAYYTRDSVFHSPEADQLLLLLHAVATPGSDPLIRAALASELIGLSARDIDTLNQDELLWEETQERFQHYQRWWNEHGFMPMFQQLLHAEQVPRRLLGQNGGERKLTNLLQLAELVQAAGREHHGVEAQLKWLQDSMHSEQLESDEYRLRLESDEGLVKIVNIHTSKGLEYPIVYLPFLWSSRPLRGQRTPPKGIYYHNGHQTVLHLAPDDDALEHADTERLAEELRLVYVALTRAQYQCVIGYGRVRELENSALAWLLHGRMTDSPLAELQNQLKDISDEALRQVLDNLAQASGGNITVESLPQGNARLNTKAVSLPELQAREASRQILQHWRMTSYSGLSSHDSSPVHEFGSRSEDADVEDTLRTQDIFHFPKGSSAGTFMHRVFEEIDFAELQDVDLRSKVRELLPQYGYDLSWETAIVDMVKQVLNTPLDGHELRLSRLTAGQRVVEMEFMYPIQSLDADMLNRLVAGLGDYTRQGPTLNFEPVTGIMRGFIDLSFEYDKRFYIVDYKSNWLGPQRQDYHPEALQAVIAQHRYDLQFLIYTLAMHRYLSASLDGYDYQQHFGGVYYLFLRGMSAQPDDNYGVYYAKPALELIEKLDGLMRGTDDA